MITMSRCLKSSICIRRVRRGRLFPFVFFCIFYPRKCWIGLRRYLFNRYSYWRAHSRRKTASWHHWRHFITIRLIRNNWRTYFLLNRFLFWQNWCRYWWWLNFFFFQFHINIHINICHIHGIIISNIYFWYDWSRHFWRVWFFLWNFFFRYFFFGHFFNRHFLFRRFLHNWLHRYRHFFFRSHNRSFFLYTSS